MLLLITYDVNTTTVSGRRRLARIAKVCCNYGQRVQNSVFECSLDNTQFIGIRAQLLSIMDSKMDSIRFYNLGNNYANRIEQYGVKQAYDPEGELIL